MEMQDKKEYIKNKTKIMYRGEKHTVRGIKTLTINGVSVIMLKIDHKRYDMWVNAEYSIKC